MGHWVVLLPPPWNREESDDTFDAFLGTERVYDRPELGRDAEIKCLAVDLEGRALLLDRVPIDVLLPEPPHSGQVSTAGRPWGKLVWLRPNLYALERQIAAFRQLDNMPTPRLAPLVRLMIVDAQWPDVEVTPLLPQNCTFLGSDANERRDGTDEQHRFVEIALSTPDFAILEGPPGSGKTTAICELIVQLACQNKRVMLVASTHVAVDNVVERLIQWQDKRLEQEKCIFPVRIGDENRVSSDDVVPFTLHRLARTWKGELLDYLENPVDGSPAGDSARRLLREAWVDEGRDGLASIVKFILESSNLVCGTTLGILQHPGIKDSRAGGAFEPFDVMILDEASKTMFGEFLVPAMFAKKWVVVGDVKQLSPYVEESELADNIRPLVPDALALGAAHGYVARKYEQRSLIVASDEDKAREIAAELRARDVWVAVANDLRPVELYGVPGAVPEWLYAEVVVGTKEALTPIQHRLPTDLMWDVGDVSALVQWLEMRRAVMGNGECLQDDSPDWASEIAWRLVRSYELRQNPAEKKKYEREIDDWLPKSFAEEHMKQRKSRPRMVKNGDRLEEPVEVLKRELTTIRRVSMPSVLELLQKGFERLSGWTQACVLTDGLPPRVLNDRLVPLSYQHRMHPDISAFPRERFYRQGNSDELERFQFMQNVAGRLLFHQELLRDADGMERHRAWGYRRYSKRAVWLAVPPGRERNRGNRNEAEVRAVMKEVSAFVEWASKNPKQGPYEVAVLTFYRGQEALLREKLQDVSKQRGHTRNFMLGQCVKLTLCTVDRFQGHEADIVFLSFVKSGSVGFLNSPNRLNVALTRARYQLVLVGDREFFRSERCKSELLRDLASSKHVVHEIQWEASR